MTHTLQEEQPAIDLEGLKARCLGNLNLVERVLSKFSTQLDADLAALEAAVSTGDTESAAQVAHRIKGMSANVEAHDLFASAVAAERMAREACVAQLSEQIQRMQGDRQRINESLKRTANSLV